MSANQFDPTEPTYGLPLSAWELAKINHALNTPTAAVYGRDNHLRMLQLHAKIGAGLEYFINAGAFTPAGAQPPADPPKQPDDSLSDAAQGPAAKKARPKKRG